MTDQEMMELAALAAGIVVVRSRLHDPLHNDMLIENSARNPYQKAGPWSPKDDDGDALRLAVKLRIGVICYGATVVTIFDLPGELGPVKNRRTHPVEGDEAAATRLAVLRAAAEMGKRMKENAA